MGNDGHSRLLQITYQILQYGYQWSLQAATDYVLNITIMATMVTSGCYKLNFKYYNMGNNGQIVLLQITY